MELMDEHLVPSGNTTRYLRVFMGTGWCYDSVPKAHPWVISKGKYLSFHQKWCVSKMVRKIHARQEILNLNPDRCMCVYFMWLVTCDLWITSLIYFLGQNCFGTRWNIHPVLKRALGTGTWPLPLLQFHNCVVLGLWVTPSNTYAPASHESYFVR